jgi:hypothetical protein
MFHILLKQETFEVFIAERIWVAFLWAMAPLTVVGTSTPKMKAADASETFKTTYETTLCHNVDDLNFNLFTWWIRSDVKGQTISESVEFAV